uniref:Uncharacterized protein n=1 Tax=Peronospora matthiolae TaxID=2874970 RepID=A0AAV1UT43_9STRA
MESQSEPVRSDASQGRGGQTSQRRAEYVGSKPDDR